MTQDEDIIHLAINIVKFEVTITLQVATKNFCYRVNKEKNIVTKV